MARPATYPTWATNANYAGGPNIGTPTKVAPSGGRMADGWRNNDVPPAQEQNYEMDLVNQWVTWCDNGQIVDLATLAATTFPALSRTYVGGAQGNYIYLSTAPFGTPGSLDGFWEVEDTNVSGNPHWEHTLRGLAANAWTGKGLAAVGPVPGDNFTVATASGRINPSIVPYGHLTHQIETPSQYTTTSTTVITPGAPGNGAALATWTIGAVNANDIIIAHLPAVGSVTSGSGFQAALLISFDNGTNYAMMSPVAPGGGTGPVVFDTTGTTSSYDLGLIGAKITPGGGGTCKVQLRGASVAAGTTKVSTGMGWIEVRRP